VVSVVYIPAVATGLTWLGHSAFRVDTPGGKRVYVDPFLSGNPKCPEDEREPERCDLVVLTHGHIDHVGDTVAIHQTFGCPVVAQVELRAWLTGQGAADDNMASSPNKGGTVAVEGVKITLTHVNHSSSAPNGSYTEILSPEPGETLTL
jgi:L-ascorbate metabolism protein UlaG (beta-lactamase superfamily)